MNCLFYFEIIDKSETKRLRQRFSMMDMEYKETMETKFSIFELKKNGIIKDKEAKVKNNMNFQDIRLYVLEEGSKARIEWLCSKAERMPHSYEDYIKLLNVYTGRDKERSSFMLEFQEIEANMLQCLRFSELIPAKPTLSVTLISRIFSLRDYSFKIVDVTPTHSFFVCYYEPNSKPYNQKFQIRGIFQKIIEDFSLARNEMRDTRESPEQKIAKFTQQVQELLKRYWAKPSTGIYPIRFDIIERMVTMEALKKLHYNL